MNHVQSNFRNGTSIQLHSIEAKTIGSKLTVNLVNYSNEYVNVAFPFKFLCAIEN